MALWDLDEVAHPEAGAAVSEDERCPTCGATVVVERRQAVPNDPDEPPGTTITTCTACNYTMIHYTDID